eukprot:TRINITY_DN28185_c0_g1_i1.p2 TRINITY_DN28185_c0_g1~~TRINITY_DN28185_c0_g1_i1.p2  ORF type:complete len:307 (-),score=76.01 TRINITY_DN28185_c0_g1_i1:73-972(-)
MARARDGGSCRGSASLGGFASSSSSTGLALRRTATCPWRLAAPHGQAARGAAPQQVPAVVPALRRRTAPPERGTATGAPAAAAAPQRLGLQQASGRPAPMDAVAGAHIGTPLAQCMASSVAEFGGGGSSGSIRASESAAAGYSVRRGGGGMGDEGLPSAAAAAVETSTTSTPPRLWRILCFGDRLELPPTDGASREMGGATVHFRDLASVDFDRRKRTLRLRRCGGQGRGFHVVLRSEEDAQQFERAILPRLLASIARGLTPSPLALDAGGALRAKDADIGAAADGGLWNGPSLLLVRR